MLVHCYTIRDGVRLLGNTSGINAIWRDLKTARGIRNRALRWCKRLNQAGDTIVIEQLDPERPYAEGKEILRLSYYRSRPWY